MLLKFLSSLAGERASRGGRYASNSLFTCQLRIVWASLMQSIFGESGFEKTVFNLISGRRFCKKKSEKKKKSTTESVFHL